jgi:hypothetical protein
MKPAPASKATRPVPTKVPCGGLDDPPEVPDPDEDPGRQELPFFPLWETVDDNINKKDGEEEDPDFAAKCDELFEPFGRKEAGAVGGRKRKQKKDVRMPLDQVPQKKRDQTSSPSSSAAMGMQE